MQTRKGFETLYSPELPSAGMSVMESKTRMAKQTIQTKRSNLDKQIQDSGHYSNNQHVSVRHGLLRPVRVQKVTTFRVPSVRPFDCGSSANVAKS